MSPKRYKDLRREIRGFRPLDLLPGLARLGAGFAQIGPDGQNDALNKDNIVTPWALTAIARESIVSGSGTTPARQVRLADIRRLCAIYADLEDPLPLGCPGADLTGYLVRTGFEQFPAQMSPFEEVARTHALYITAAADRSDAPLLSEDAWARQLGVPFETFLGAGFLLHVWASLHDGWVDLSWLNMPQFAPITGALDETLIKYSVERYMAASFPEFKELDRKTLRKPGLLEHRFNPLEARPLLKTAKGLLAPSPSLLMNRISATGIYYDRCTEPGFTDQLGPVFQHYVGINLKLIPTAAVLPEIEYARSQFTVDWIVIFDDLVVLVEAKATRLTEAARAGVPEALDLEIDRTLVRAHVQIETTARLIRDRHPALADVPGDRPILGLTATLEPYHFLGTQLTPLPKPPGAVVPVVMASAREIEHLAGVALSQDVGPLLRALFDEGQTGSRALSSLPQGPEMRNPLLDSAWDRMNGWLDIARELRQRNEPA